jgi:hypothetical protein
MKTLKAYVKNRARPEGCIAERCLAEEYMKYCSEYIKEANQISDRNIRNEDLENTVHEGRSISRGEHITISSKLLQAAHRYVLFNTAEVEPYEE